MAEGYVRMLEAFRSTLDRWRTPCADGEDPVPLHRGKDRTGITAMLLLGLAEVGDGHVLDDYEISARHQPEGASTPSPRC